MSSIGHTKRYPLKPSVPEAKLLKSKICGAAEPKVLARVPPYPKGVSIGFLIVKNMFFTQKTLKSRILTNEVCLSK